MKIVCYHVTNPLYDDELIAICEVEAGLLVTTITYIGGWYFTEEKSKEPQHLATMPFFMNNDVLEELWSIEL